jgi:uncharacterized protein (TIGR02594 family)
MTPDILNHAYLSLRKQENSRHIKNWQRQECENGLHRVKLIPWLMLAIAIFILMILFFFCNTRLARAEISPLAITQSQIGLGEMGGNNQGKYIRQYLNGRENLPWCAGFVSYCIKKAGANIPYTLRAKNFLGFGKRLKISELKPGDIVVFNRQGGGHVGIIEKLNKDNFISIEGNIGEYPAKVKRVKHSYTEKNICGFVRIK